MHIRREQVSNKNISVRSKRKREIFDSIEREREREEGFPRREELTIDEIKPYV